MILIFILQRTEYDYETNSLKIPENNCPSITILHVLFSKIEGIIYTLVLVNENEGKNR